MKITSVLATNFASYDQLAFDFNDRGLTLIHGPTGSGKSTLCDLVPWALFGSSSKGGAVSEVLSWPGDKVTEVTLTVQIGSHVHTIHRSRGPKAKDNDLSIDSPGDLEPRGRDLPDTQKLINQRLGLNLSTYLAAAYYHEFSETAQFFTTTAKARRAICEQLVDLSLPIALKAKADASAKDYAKLIAKCDNELQTVASNLNLTHDYLSREKHRLAHLDKANALTIATTNTRIEALKSDLDLISARHSALSDQLGALPQGTCSECGANKNHKERDALKAKLSTVEREIDLTLSKIERLAETKAQRPDDTSRVAELQDNILDLNARHQDLTLTIAQLKDRADDLNLLNQVTADFRSSLIASTIKDLEAKTNYSLQKHFDGELQIEFSAADADKIEVQITKDGNTCAYTQLSKGQRQLLKLSFGVAVMRAVANHHGIELNCLFLDESLDGCDDNFKLKAIALLEELSLEYESVFIVEHSATVKAMVPNQVAVALVNGRSEIEP